MALADAYDAFLLDLDGVLYRGNEAIPGAGSAVAGLRQRGPVVFLTNNSARTPERIAEKLRGLGIDAAPHEVVTSAQAAAPLLRERVGDGATVFVVGGEGVRTALDEAGLKVADETAEHADAVVVGWDPDATYERLRRASVLIQRGALLVATNADASFPAPGGELWPGAGALLAAIETATGARAEVAGKPHPPLFEEALSRAGTRRALMIGDRVDTDLAGAAAAGLDALFVRSGASTVADLLDHDASPVAVAASIADVLADIAPVRVREAGSEDDERVTGLVRESGLAELPGTSRRLVTENGAGTAAIRVDGEEAYLHSVAVDADARGTGIGSLLVAAAVRSAVRDGARTCFLVTEDADAFFARLGFEDIDRGMLPEWIQPLATECTVRATAMRRAIGQSAQGGLEPRGSRTR